MLAFFLSRRDEVWLVLLMYGTLMVMGVRSRFLGCLCYLFSAVPFDKVMWVVVVVGKYVIDVVDFLSFFSLSFTYVLCTSTKCGDDACFHLGRVV